MLTFCSQASCSFWAKRFERPHLQSVPGRAPQLGVYTYVAMWKTVLGAKHSPEKAIPCVRQGKSARMTKGVEIRSQIDTETVRALLLINGGGAIALLTLFTSLIGKQEYRQLALFILIGVLLLMVGLVCAVLHNRFRRKCSLDCVSGKFGNFQLAFASERREAMRSLIEWTKSQSPTPGGRLTPGHP
jgi:hypothetical protein